MGKGYNNYMCKKPFHPGSKANIKRSWMAEQKTENDKKKQEELKAQYEKEQDLYNNRALLSTESKDKLELNFMYEAPPGAKRERQKEDDEPEYKFEWQRKYNAPREDYAKGNADIKDQPFGIPVRNVRCIKCHKWGHINTDKECPLFSQASTSSMPTTSMDPMELMRQMREDGYGLKENVLGHHLNPKAANQQLLSSEESDPEMEFLKSLSTAEKKKLLRKLKKLSKKQEKSMNCKKKKSRKSKKSKYSSDSDCGGKKKCKKSKKTFNDTSSEESEPKDTKKKHKKLEAEKSSKRLKRKSSSESSSTESESEEEKLQTKAKKLKQDHKNAFKDQYSSNEEAKTGKYPKTDKDKQEIEKLPQYKSSSDFKMSNQSLKTNSKNKSKQKNSSDSEHSSKEEYLSYSKNEENKNLKHRKSNESTKHNQSNEDRIKDIKHKKNHKEKIDIPKSAEISKRKRDSSTSSETVTQMHVDKTTDELSHPDGFSHLNPQAIIKSNYVLSVKEYEGCADDKFRLHNRERRSPSVKQKYNK